MTRVNSYDFGKIVIDGKVYERDVLILPSGKILPRPMPKGTHTICFSEFEEIIKEKPETIVIGTGASGIAELEKDVKEKLESLGIKILIEPTRKAINTYNKLKNKKAALFHLTC